MIDRRFGPHLSENGVLFSLWAPNARSVDLICDGQHSMSESGDGWFSLHRTVAKAGSRYKFLIDGETLVPDPASQFQPEDVGGPSEVIDHNTYRWSQSDWRGRPWEDAIFLETHVGTYTSGGTYRDMIGKLDHIADTGFTALELMPLADFSGQRNWGYDGVLWYAPDHSYGRPDDLKALIDEAHTRGLMVFLDVVYNHFGPEGNFLHRYASKFFCATKTPWGDAIDYGLAEVRSFAIQNALHWLEHYRFDGLRLDAVHALAEPGGDQLLAELSDGVGKLAERTGRHIHLVLENDDNRAALLDPDQDPPRGKYRAQWNDDYHHAWHVLLTGEDTGYYGDYASPEQKLLTALTSGFAYQGEASAHRGGVARGEPSGALPPRAFVNFLQNHDQIGNRPLGDRLEKCATTASIEAALAITLLAPMSPLLFMGDEWGTQAPFPFFRDFHGDLAKAVREGRRREFRSAYERYGDEIPDPLNKTTFASAKLDWSELNEEAHRKRHQLVRRLVDIRRREIVPRLRRSRFAARPADNALAQWTMGDGTTLTLIANLSSERRASAVREFGRSIWSGNIDPAEPWTVVWMLS